MSEGISGVPHLRIAGTERPHPVPSPPDAALRTSGVCCATIGSLMRISKPARKRMF